VRNLLRAKRFLAQTGEQTSDLPLSFKSAKFWARVDNLGIQVYQILGITRKTLYRKLEEYGQPIEDDS